jgi:hypothetical protein
MTTPSTSDLNMYDGTPFDQTDHDGNWTQSVTWLTSGNYDVTFQNVTATTFTGLPTETFNVTAGEDISAGDVLRISSGNAVKATNINDTGITQVIGVATQTVTSGATVAVSNQFYESYSSLIVGAAYYIGVDGGITVTNPGVRAYIIGYAVSSTRLNLNVKPQLESKELRNSGFITKTLDVTVGGSNKYKIIDYSSGINAIAGIFFAIPTGTITNIYSIYAVSTNSSTPIGTATAISNNLGLIFGIDNNNSVFVQASLGGGFNLRVTYFISGYYSQSQLLDTAVQI